ncbi:MAG: peptidoglycan-associated lipoprotein Pal [Gammaproteobacteria bacterium]
MKWSKLLLSVVLLVSLAGCEFVPVKKDGDKTQDQQQDQAKGVDLQGGYDIKSLDDPNSPLSRRVIYFDLDSSSISDEDRELISAHAAFLAANPQVSAILEGHADERGTREYNIALGERRAKAVQQLLSVQGVAENQAQVISFGEERPVALEHNEAGWRLNRRVEILYSGY